jgi:hypothetical protein
MAHDLDALYQLPPAEFIAARNAMAASRRKAGKRDEAERIKALPKPSITAWAVNTLYWKQRKPFERLIASGDALRRAQASQLAGRSTDLRGPLGIHREALTELSRLAASALEAAGHPATPDLMRRIMTTLEALSTAGSAPDAPTAGRLADDVQPTGFDTLAALVPRSQARDAPSAGRGAVIQFRRKTHAAAAARPTTARDAKAIENARRKAREAAMAARKAAEQALRDARAATQRAEVALKQAARRVKAAEAARVEAETRLERATADLTAARQDARRVATAAEEAATAVGDAERAVEQAKQKA